MFTIKEFSNIIGLEPHQLRKLEEDSKLPGKRGSNGYRVYDLDSALLINSVLIQKGLGLSAREAVNHIAEQDTDSYKSRLKSLLDDCPRQKMLLECRENRLKYILDLIEHHDEYLNVIEQTQGEALYYLQATEGSDFTPAMEQGTIVRSIVKDCELINLCGHFSSDDLDTNNLGYFIGESVLKIISVPKEAFKKTGDGKYLKMLLRRTENMRFSREVLERFHRYADEHGLECGKDILVHYVDYNCRELENLCVVYIAVKNKTKNS